MKAHKDITWKIQMKAHKDITWKIQMIAQKDIYKYAKKYKYDKVYSG